MHAGDKSDSSLCRIILVDEHRIMLSGLQAMLSSKTNVQVIATISDPHQVMDQLHLKKPNLVITDVATPVEDSIASIRKMKQQFPNMSIVALTFQKEASIVSAALQAGADAYVLKDDSYDELLQAIEKVLAGNEFVSSSIAKEISAL